METEYEIKFIPLYKSYREDMSELTLEERALIYEGMQQFAFDGIEPEFKSPSTRIVWKFIKRNLINNITNINKNSNNGKKGGRPSKSTLIQPQTPKVDTKVVLKEKIQPEVNKGVITPIQSNLIIYTKEKIKNDEYQDIFTNLIMSGNITTIKEIEDELLHLT